MCFGVLTISQRRKHRGSEADNLGAGCASELTTFIGEWLHLVS